MKLKYYLRGIGIGVFFTTIIFMISIAIHKEDFVQRPTETEEVASGTVADLQEKESEVQMTEEMVMAETETSASNEPVDVQMAETENMETETVEEKLSDETATEESAGEKESITIEVVAGEFSDQVCVKLREAGLVEDAWDFNVYLMGIDYDNLIRPGTYEIPVGAGYEEIADVLVPWKKAGEAEASE